MPPTQSSGTPRPADPAGVIVVNKPSGPTSHDIVAKVRKHLKVKRAGHTGTLDPLASGVLVVCVGEATKLAGYLTHAEKGYETTARLGVVTDTHDSTGEVLEEHEVNVTREDVEGVLEGFRGQIAQIPPMFSALKKGGQRLYKLARKGEVVEREPRIVQVHRLELTRFEPPHIDLSIACGKGTYVRTLAHDIGAALGCGAHLEALVRTRVGGFSLDQAVDFEDLLAVHTPEEREAMRSRMIPMADAMPDLPVVRVDKRLARGLGQGRALNPGELAQAGGGGLRPGQLVRILDEVGLLLALGEVKSHGLQPVRVFKREGQHA